MGVINLIRLTWQDFHNNCMVDDRLNYLMLGATLMLLNNNHVGLTYLLCLIFGANLLVQVLKARKVFGEADLTTTTWTFLGFGFLGFKWLGVYLVTLALSYACYALVMRIIILIRKKKVDKVQGYPIFLMAFLVMVVYYIMS